MDRANYHGANDLPYAAIILLRADTASKIVLKLPKRLSQLLKMNYLKIAEKDPLLKESGKKFTEELEKFEKEYAEKTRKNPYYWREYSDRRKTIKRMMEYFENIRKAERKQEYSFLRGTWSQITELISELEDEPYSDGKVQIEKI